VKDRINLPSRYGTAADNVWNSPKNVQEHATNSTTSIVWDAYTTDMTAAAAAKISWRQASCDRWRTARSCYCVCVAAAVSLSRVAPSPPSAQIIIKTIRRCGGGVGGRNARANANAAAGFPRRRTRIDKKSAGLLRFSTCTPYRHRTPSKIRTTYIPCIMCIYNIRTPPQTRPSLLRRLDEIDYNNMYIRMYTVYIIYNSRAGGITTVNSDTPPRNHSAYNDEGTAWGGVCATRWKTRENLKLSERYVTIGYSLHTAPL